jgi:hypothetical protein
MLPASQCEFGTMNTFKGSISFEKEHKNKIERNNNVRSLWDIKNLTNENKF